MSIGPSPKKPPPSPASEGGLLGRLDQLPPSLAGEGWGGGLLGRSPAHRDVPILVEAGGPARRDEAGGIVFLDDARALVRRSELTAVA